MKEIQFDYEQLAKKLMEKMPGSLKAISLQDIVDEYLVFVKRMRDAKTVGLIKTAKKRLLKFFPGNRI